MERHSPILTTQESLRYRAETELESCYAASGMTRTSGLLQDCDHRSTTAQGKMVSVLYTYPHYKTNSRIIRRIIRFGLVVHYQPDYQVNYQPDYPPGNPPGSSNRSNSLVISPVTSLVVRTELLLCAAQPRG